MPFLDILEPLKSVDAWWEEVAAGDGIHPGARGYAALASLVELASLAGVAALSRSRAATPTVAASGFYLPVDGSDRLAIGGRRCRRS